MAARSLTVTRSRSATVRRFSGSSLPTIRSPNFSNLAIPFTLDTDTSAEIAERIRTAINQSSQLNIEAASSSGIDTGTLTDNRLNLYGAVSGSLLPVASPQAAPAALSTGPEGDILMPAILHDGVGDSNYRRIQSAVIIENNVISDARAIGIWSEPGDRDVDPEDLRQSPEGGFFGFGFGFTDPFEEGPVTDRHPFLQQPPVGNVYPGAARNLPTLNDAVIGGLAPGVVVRNNTVDQAGLAGIKIDGETRPWMIDGLDGLTTPIICDGLAMAIDAGGTRVVFEFEDISGAPTHGLRKRPVVGGDGFADGHVPIYYRRADGGPYNNPAGGGVRDYGYSSFEIMLSIQQSIQGSILVTNGLAELVTPYLGPSLSSRDEFSERFARTPESFPTAAVYLTGPSNVYFTSAYAKGGGSIPSVSLAPVGEAVQPLARLVNNTIYGADGVESQFVGDPTEEGNDLLSNAVVTHVGRAHTGPFIADAAIGDIPPGLVSPANDVDIYRVELVVGDRLVVDIDTESGTTLTNAITDADTTVTVADADVFTDPAPFDINIAGETMRVTAVNGNNLTVTRGATPVAHAAGSTVTGPGGVDTSVRIFDEFGIAQTLAVVMGVEETVNRAGVAPTHLDPESAAYNPVNDFGSSFDPFVDFTALKTGTYYVAVSGDGNDDYDPSNLSGRTNGTGGLGDYQIGLEVYAPRSVVLSIDDGSEGGGNLGTRGSDVIGETFTITQIPDFAPGTPNLPGGNVNTVGNQITFEFTTGGIVRNGNIAVPLLLDYRVPDIMRAIANAVTGLQDTTSQRDIPTIPNHENGNGPDGRTGPITRARARTPSADRRATTWGSLTCQRGPSRVSSDLASCGFPLHYLLQNDSDFDTGFGHDRRRKQRDFGRPGQHVHRRLWNDRVVRVVREHRLDRVEPRVRSPRD